MAAGHSRTGPAEPAESVGDWIRRTLAAAPPLTGEQLTRLRALLTPRAAASGDSAGGAA